jgi:hypothetical protein
MGWRLSMELYEASLVSCKAGGMRLSARSLTGEWGWCRRLRFGVEGAEYDWEEPLAVGDEGSTWGRLSWALDKGLYEAQSAGANEERYYRLYVVVLGEGKESKMFKEFAPAWKLALGAGLVVPPTSAALWGTVRSMCAQEQWHEVKTELLPLLPLDELREQLEAYCAGIRNQWHARLAAQLKLPRLKGSAAQVEWGEERRAAYALGYMRVKQAWDKVEEAYSEALLKPSHKRGKKDIKRLEEQLMTKRDSSTWSTSVGLWNPRYIADYAEQLEQMYEALSNGREVGRKNTKRFAYDADAARRAEAREASEMHERLQARRKELGILQRDLVEQLGLKTTKLSEYERGREGTTHDVLWSWANALRWSVVLVDIEAAGVVCTPGSSSDGLVALYEELRERRAMSRQEVAHRSGWTLESLEDLEAQVKRGAQLTVVHAQLWARALGWRYEVGDSVER